MDAQGEPARYEAERAIDVATNRVTRRDRGQGAAMTILKWLLGLCLAGAMTLCIAVGLWWAAIPLGLFCVLSFQRRQPKPQLVGLWHGTCPLSRSEIWIHAPPKAQNYRFGCPGCTQRLTLKDGRFAEGGAGFL